MPLTAREVDELKHAPAVEGILSAVHRRWSTRAFGERAVSAETLKRLFEAARWAPSSNNEQPWLYVVGERGSATHEALAGALMGFNKAWAPRAAVLVVGLAHKVMTSNGKPNGYALYDLGAATALLVLQATELGLASHQMGGFVRDEVRASLGIPDEYEFGSVIALGYQDDPGTLGDEQMIAREVAPRTRKPLKEQVFTAWGEPAGFVE